MKAISFLIAFVLMAISNLCAKFQMQSRDWIDLSNKSDTEIVRILEKEIAQLDLSPAYDANERVITLQMQEKDARQTFNQKVLLLESALGAAAASKESVEKAFADLQTDSTALSAQLDLHARSQQRLQERINKFPFKVVVLAKAIYSGNLELVKEKILYDSGRLAIQEVNGIGIISETLVRNNVIVSDIIESTTEGKAECQAREWKTIENGTQRVIYLYGIYDIYPLSESVKLSNQAAQLRLHVETHFIRDVSNQSLPNLPINIQQEIRTMLGIAQQANVEVRNNLNTLVEQEVQLLRNSGSTEERIVLENRFNTLRSQMEVKRSDLFAKRKAYDEVSKQFWDHLNSESRIEIVTQSDLERNRSQDLIKAKLMNECLIQFRTTVKSLYSQEKAKVINFQLAETSQQSLFRHVKLRAVRILGIYLSPSEGDIKYTASVAFRFGFDYATNSSNLADENEPKKPQANQKFQWSDWNRFEGGYFGRWQFENDRLIAETTSLTAGANDWTYIEYRKKMYKYDVSAEVFVDVKGRRDSVVGFSFGAWKDWCLTLEPDRWHTLRLIVRGNRVILQLDESFIRDQEVNYSTSNFQLKLWCSRVFFKNITVSPVP